MQVAVIQLADGTFYNVECFLTGQYKKWSSNHVIYDVLSKEDDVRILSLAKQLQLQSTFKLNVYHK